MNWSVLFLVWTTELFVLLHYDLASLVQHSVLLGICLASCVLVVAGVLLLPWLRRVTGYPVSKGIAYTLLIASVGVYWYSIAFTSNTPKTALYLVHISIVYLVGSATITSLVAFVTSVLCVPDRVFDDEDENGGDDHGRLDVSVHTDDLTKPLLSV